MATATTPAPSKPAAALTRYYEVHPLYRLGLRWLLIGALTALAFHDTFISLAVTTREGGIGGYVWTVPLVAGLVAISVSRRKRTELPIHDRQTDIIVGSIGLGMALLIQAALLERYALYFHLLRLDVIAAWLFVASCCVVLFGLRPVIRFAWVWAMFALAFSLPYYLAVILLGGGKFAAGAVTLLIAAIGTGTAVGRTFRRGVIGSLRAWVFGFAVLVAIWWLFPDAPVLVYQQVPAVAAISVVGTVMYLQARRGVPKRLLDRKVEPLAAKQVWAGVPLVVAVAVALSLCSLPTQTSTVKISRPSPDTLVQGRPLDPPPGWKVIEQQEFPQVRRLYGDGAVLVRQYMLAESGNPDWDKLSRPRTIVVDSIVSRRPFSFGTIPARVLYGLTSARISAPRLIDLDMGVHGRLTSVVDDRLLVTWNSVQFAWGDDNLAQRVTAFAVDNHDPDAPFPTPSTSVASNIQTLITLLFRGNAVLDQRTPSFKDEDLLRTFTRALVAGQFR
ncbi:MFS transporter [Mycolicibacterium diernhoferi]|uniref:MFS transporter n=1 Tax=Mycolicibacterium diernhoferi TaxID=1801 RepID=A0A1Q4HEL5_9MYCO|nr:MFS transporter [Mycolicibacterium diernhoferi]OJZ65957.1 hypothetical protein BRW64_11125 [Mycolicibacterium diernhoferi]OPE55526.1 hypothetical protein BV510_04630 [Mycolicibacterium diernhoferi]PEG53328.1 MFS transporter [Mycolicibacterium diernhoferi]QYL23865.1 MFS transporter [Mycolicibacterium diernhoferi]